MSVVLRVFLILIAVLKK